MSYDCSAAALRPLMDTYWSSDGWRQPPAQVPAENRARAESAGVMFAEDDRADHDGWVTRARNAADRADLYEVAQAFLASLTSRRLDLRSALSSLILARVLPDHPYTTNAQSTACSICGLDPTSSTDLNVLSFERFKWGGVRKLDIRYVTFDLEQFEAAPKLKATQNDTDLWRSMLQAIGRSDLTTTANTLTRALRPIPGNLAERSSLVGTLGVCSVLQTTEHRGFVESWTDYSERNLPKRHFIDAPYPVCWWTARDGVNKEALQELSLGVDVL